METTLPEQVLIHLDMIWWRGLSHCAW